MQRHERMPHVYRLLSCPDDHVLPCPVCPQSIQGGASDVGESITQYASLKRADLLVMGCRGMGAVRRAMLSLIGLGSVSDYVLHNATCPVLVIKQPHASSQVPLSVTHPIASGSAAEGQGVGPHASGTGPPAATVVQQLQAGAATGVKQLHAGAATGVGMMHAGAATVMGMAQAGAATVKGIVQAGAAHATAAKETVQESVAQLVAAAGTAAMREAVPAAVPPAAPAGESVPPAYTCATSALETEPPVAATAGSAAGVMKVGPKAVPTSVAPSGFAAAVSGAAAVGATHRLLAPGTGAAHAASSGGKEMEHLAPGGPAAGEAGAGTAAEQEAGQGKVLSGAVTIAVEAEAVQKAATGGTGAVLRDPPAAKEGSAVPAALAPEV